MEIFTPAFGRVEDQESVERFFSSQPDPMISSAARDIMTGPDDDADVDLCQIYETVTGKKWNSRNQNPRGFCVGFGNAKIATLSIAMMAHAGEITWPGADVAIEPVYGGMRYEVGYRRYGSGLYRGGDGGVGTWAAEWLLDWGVLLMQPYEGVDLSQYDMSRCASYGGRGVPDELEPIAKLHPLAKAALCSGGEDVWKLMGQLHPTVHCSNQGFSMSRNRDGTCRANDTWPHCYPADTWISGIVMRKIQDIKVGDVVHDHAGKEQKVLQIFRRHYRGNMVRLSVMSGISTTVTEDHPVLVYRRVRGLVKTMAMAGVVENCQGSEYTATNGRNYRPVWVRARDVRPNDFLVTPTCQFRETDPGHPAVKKSSELAWLFGFLIGDGYASKSHRVVLRVGKSKPWQRAIEAFQLLGITATVREYPTFVEIRAHHADLANWFRAQFYNKEGDKIIPQWLLSWDQEALLEGLMAADGSFYKGRYCYITVSKSLAIQIRHLLVNQGEKVTMHRLANYENKFPNAREQFAIEYTKGSNRGKVRLHNGNLLVSVKSVLLLPFDGEVYNFEVENTNSYIADGYATHNCAGWSGRFTLPSGQRVLRYENSWNGTESGQGYLGSPITVEGRNGPIKLNGNQFLVPIEIVDRMCRSGKETFAMTGPQGFTKRRPLFMV